MQIDIIKLSFEKLNHWLYKFIIYYKYIESQEWLNRLVYAHYPQKIR